METLADARAFIFALTERQLDGPQLKLAVQMMDVVSGDWMMVSEAGEQIRVALKAGG